MDEIDRIIINQLQGDFPLRERAFAAAGERLGIGEEELIRRVQSLLERGLLSRFGPMYQAERLGGGLSLCAMQVPTDRYDEVTELVNAHPEVAHNYARDHRLNMWFVLATGSPEGIGQTLQAIEAETGLPVLNLPKEREFFVGLRFEV